LRGIHSLISQKSALRLRNMEYAKLYHLKGGIHHFVSGAMKEIVCCCPEHHFLVLPKPLSATVT
jgi:hypothetical protein